MRNASNDFKNHILETRNFTYEVMFTFSDGDTRRITSDELMANGCQIVQSPGVNSFPLGCAVAKNLTLVLMNSDDRWSEYNFYGARINITLCCDVPGRPDIERIPLGRYTVIEPETYGSTITVTAMDDFYKADRPFGQILLPCTAYDLYREALRQSGLTAKTPTFYNSDYKIAATENKNPLDDLTCREVIGYCAMLAGGNAYIDSDGYVVIKSYDLSSLIDGLDGGDFNKYGKTGLTTGKYRDADGGNFIDYSSGDSVDGGYFGDRENFHVLSLGSSLTVCTDDVTITGISTTLDKETYTFGKAGYMLEINNPLIVANPQDAVTRIGLLLNDLTFRPFTLDSISYPLAEIGDICCVIDRKNRDYISIITDVDFSFRGATVIKCTADSPIRNSSKYSSPATKAIQEAKSLIEAETSARQRAQEELNKAINAHEGLYCTKYTDDTIEGMIVFLHNKYEGKAEKEGDLPPGIEKMNGSKPAGIIDWGNSVDNWYRFTNSDIVWKMTAKAIGVSTDHGRTYSYGFTANGLALLNSVVAYEVDADHISSGILVVGGNGRSVGSIQIKDDSNKPLVWFDKDGMHLEDSQKIQWSNVNAPSDLAKTSQIPTEQQITNISYNAISTATVSANQVVGGTISGIDVLGGHVIQYKNGARDGKCVRTIIMDDGMYCQIGDEEKYEDCRTWDTKSAFDTNATYKNMANSVLIQADKVLGIDADYGIYVESKDENGAGPDDKAFTGGINVRVRDKDDRNEQWHTLWFNCGILMNTNLGGTYRHHYSS